MGDGASQPQLATGSTGRFQLALLARDPGTGYVYWEWPGAGEASSPATLTLSARDPDGSWRDVASFQVSTALGDRFVDFAAGGVEHRCRFVTGEKTRTSETVVAPRAEEGPEPAHFVRVQVCDDGLHTEPVDYDDPVHGKFPSAPHRPPSSDAPSDNG